MRRELPVIAYTGQGLRALAGYTRITHFYSDPGQIIPQDVEMKTESRARKER